MPADANQDLFFDVQRYRHNAAVVARAHFLAWERYTRWNRFFGVPVVVMTALVGTAIFGTLQQNPELHWRILAGVISISATVLAALQTYLNFAEQAEKHKEAGHLYADFRRQFDLLAIEMSQKGTDFNDQAITVLKEIVSKLNEVSKNCPSIPDNIYDIASNKLRRELCPPILCLKTEHLARNRLEALEGFSMPFKSARE